MRMPRRVLTRIASTALVVSALLFCPLLGRADTLGRLIRWEGPAALAANQGPGYLAYVLIALAERERNAFEPGKYDLRVALPDGQVDTRTISEHEVRSGRLTVLVRATAVRNLRPEQVLVRVSVVPQGSGASIGSELTATIADFPHPAPEGTRVDPGPFGWGRPLATSPSQSTPLSRPGPDSLTFVRIPSTGAEHGFFLATTEATNGQLSRRLPDYDPRAGRSDEFTLEDPAQPALNLSPNRAKAYLAALSKADSSGVTYRLPTQSEWNRAARASRSSTFWWGDEPTFPTGANLLGPEPALTNDTTAPARPSERAIGFQANPWRLFHTFGNVSEWASLPSGGFVRLGGHFRTEPASPLPEVAVEDVDSTGPDPYVGVRPAFDLAAETGAALVRKALGEKLLQAGVTVAFDPDRATATLSGTLSDSSLRREADRRLSSLWFLAAVENQIVTPTVDPGQLATLGEVVGRVRRITPLGRWVYEVPVAIRWGDPLPVRGSEWWVNIYPAGGGHFAHKLVEIAPDASRQIIVLIDKRKMAAAGQSADCLVSVALSLGAEAPSPSDPQVVSNLAPLHWSVP